MEDYIYIAEHMTEEAILCQIAEEAAELAQAALKYRRALKQDSPTDVTDAEARGNLIEEMADVLNAVRVWGCKNGTAELIKIDGIAYVKKKRWVERLQKKNTAPEREVLDNG